MHCFCAHAQTQVNKCEIYLAISSLSYFFPFQMRQKILASAYLRAMKDPFPPARQAAVIAMAATNNFFTLQESAARLVPALCSMVMDPEKVVRDQVFKIYQIKFFMAINLMIERVIHMRLHIKSKYSNPIIIVAIIINAGNLPS